MFNKFKVEKGKLVKKEAEQKQEEVVTTEPEKMDTEPKTETPKPEEQPVPKEDTRVFKVIISCKTKDFVYEVEGEDKLITELDSIEQEYLDRNRLLMYVPQQVIVKKEIIGWSYGSVPNYEAGDDGEH